MLYMPFRELFCRLGVRHVHLPPARLRKSSIEIVSNYATQRQRQRRRRQSSAPGTCCLSAICPETQPTADGRGGPDKSQSRAKERASETETFDSCCFASEQRIVCMEHACTPFHILSNFGRGIGDRRQGGRRRTVRVHISRVPPPRASGGHMTSGGWTPHETRFDDVGRLCRSADRSRVEE